MELPTIPARAETAHKGKFGKILIVGGSRAMPGAASLAGAAALRGGAGLVRIAVPLTAATAVSSHFSCYTLVPCPETDKGTLGRDAASPILQAVENADVMALGPGIGFEPDTAGLVLSLIRDIPLPLVVDADGLNILARDLSVVQKRKNPTILTPHPGEFARLAKTRTPPDETKRLDAARELARRLRSIVLLKGHGTVVTDGERYHVNETGNPGMATAGSGDVLTGLIASLLHVIDDPFEAAALGAHIHGLAGDLAAASVGQISLTANDILDHLPQAFRSYSNGNGC